MLADEQLADEDRAVVFGKGGAKARLIAGQIRHKRFGHRADSALRRAVEGGTVFPVEPLRAVGLQPAQGSPGLCKGIVHRGRSDIQRDHLYLRIGRGGGGYAKMQANRDAGARQQGGKIGGPGDIIRKAAQKRTHLRAG